MTAGPVAGALRLRGSETAATGADHGAALQFKDTLQQSIRLVPDARRARLTWSADAQDRGIVCCQPFADVLLSIRIIEVAGQQRPLVSRRAFDRPFRPRIGRRTTRLRRVALPYHQRPI